TEPNCFWKPANASWYGFKLELITTTTSFAANAGPGKSAAARSAVRNFRNAAVILGLRMSREGPLDRCAARSNRRQIRCVAARTDFVGTHKVRHSKGTVGHS